MEYAICYVSTATRDLSKGEINSLLEFCKANNDRHNIKGILLYSDGNFFQVLEGEKKAVLGLMEKIKADDRHHSIIQVVGREVEEGSYDHYQVENLSGKQGYRSKIIDKYLESVKGMERQTQVAIKSILHKFIDTRVF